MSGEECIHVENIESNLNDKTAENKKNLIGRVVGKLNMKDQTDGKTKNAVLLDLLKPMRYTPLSVKEISKNTQFEIEEVKCWYRAFKQMCPDGISSEETFKEIFGKIYPLGDSSKYAHLVFISIDREDTGRITFGDFIQFLSNMSKGSMEEKIKWSFIFYDVNRDGVISRDEMMKVGGGIKINIVQYFPGYRCNSLPHTCRSSSKADVAKG